MDIEIGLIFLVAAIGIAFHLKPVTRIKWIFPIIDRAIFCLVGMYTMKQIYQDEVLDGIMFLVITLFISKILAGISLRRHHSSGDH